MKGKILYIGGFKLPAGNAAAQRVTGNAKAIRALGYEVVLIGVSDNPRLGKFESEGFTCYEIKYPVGLREWIRYLWSIEFISEKIKVESVDTVILYNFPSLQMYRLMKRFRPKVNFLSDVTEWYFSSGYGVDAVIKRIDVWYRMKVLHKRMDGLIVISSFLKDYYSRFLKNIILIPPLVDLDDNKWQNCSLNSPDRGFEIKFVYSGSPGTGGKDKLDVIIDCLNLAKKATNTASIKLLVVGVTKEEYLSSFRGYNTDFTNIEFLGRVDHFDALQIVSECNYAIFFRDPTRVNNAGFPTKFVEAISLGVPVITNKTSDLEHYYNNYPDKLGFIVDELNDHDKIVETLQTAISAVNDGRFELMRAFCQKSKLFDFNNYRNEFRKML